MASLATACRLSARITARQLRQDATSRGFRSSAKVMAAQNFTMPALSPTMTEGNIAKWAIKEGDSFSAGDVLLEIETDKASMDVEAQDDGIMAKIIQGDGSKAIKVGARIGVLADAGDDLSTLEIPAEESSSEPEPKKEAPKSASQPSESKSEEAPQKSAGKAKEQTYPLLPSVGHLMHENNISESDISKMTPSGPNGRLLKGDVLAYLGSISSSYPAELSSKIEKLTHLDLSNIKLAAPTPKPAPKAAEASKPTPSAPKETVVLTTISMKAVLEVQKRIQNTLGVFMPLSTFIARATEMANDNLPRSKSTPLSSDELFNQVLGLDTVSTSSGTRGTFMPQIIATAGPSVPNWNKPKKVDLIDILAGNGAMKGAAKRVQRQGMSNESNTFSLVVPEGEKGRAETFLSRVKTVLEVEPGRLVL